MLNTKTGASFAVAAALLAVSGLSTAAQAKHHSSSAEVVHCYGVNSCKGTSDCKSNGHECKGQNECKGQGFKAKTAQACAKAGGSLTEK